MTTILLAEDDEIMRITLQDNLEKQNWKVDAVTNGQEAMEKIAQHRYHLVLSDIRMPGVDGLHLLASVREHSPYTDIIMMTAYGSVNDAIDCLKKGASDYILKPFDIDDLIIRINRVFAMQSIKARCASLEDCCRQSQTMMIGNSKPIRKIQSMIKQVGPSDAAVLITGESGTGKELAADGLHQASLRANKPYIRINCAAIPDGLMESELFGHEKGAFTGAHARKPGKFEMADGGTLLLDEIGDMPMDLQAKLLRILQEGECERVGGTQTIRIDVRILCSTAKDLAEEVKQGRFRRDLFYRIGVIPLIMPPLRERRDDIPLLANHFLHEFSIKRGMALELSAEAMRCLINYDFPGNVRELRNIIERISVLTSEPVITFEDLPLDIRSQSKPDQGEPIMLSEALAQTEKQCVLNALALTGGNRTRAAELLGISRKNLWEKMKLHDIQL